MKPEYENALNHCLCGPSCCVDEGVTRDTRKILEAYASATGQNPDMIFLTYVQGVGRVFETIAGRFNSVTVKDVVAEALGITAENLEAVLEKV